MRKKTKENQSTPSNARRPTRPLQMRVVPSDPLQMRVGPSDPLQMRVGPSDPIQMRGSEAVVIPLDSHPCPSIPPISRPTLGNRGARFVGRGRGGSSPRTPGARRRRRRRQSRLGAGGVRAGRWWECGRGDSGRSPPVNSVPGEEETSLREDQVWTAARDARKTADVSRRTEASGY